jgi:O-antigen ligase
LLLIVLILTFSREAWLALFVGIVVVLWFQNKIAKALTIIVVSAVLFGIVWQLVPGFTERTLSQVKSVDDYVRFRNALVAVQILKTSPAFGIGPGMWGGSAAVLLGSPVMEKYLIYTSTADSNWLSMTVEFGILGSCMFLGLLFAVFRRSLKYLYKARSTYKAGDSFRMGIFLGTSVSVIGFVLLALVSPAFENQQISFYVWFFAGVSQALIRNDAGGL